MNKGIFVLRHAMLAACLSMTSVVIAQEQDAATNRPNSEKLAPNQLNSLKPLDCNGEPAATSRMTLATKNTNGSRPSPKAGEPP